MVYTVTFNPSLDYILNTEKLSIGVVNRSSSEYYECGGKGINVSRMLTNLGVRNTALGFVGGFVGDEIIRSLNALNVKNDFIKTNGNSRINVKLRHGEDTEVNALGPLVETAHVDSLTEKIKNMHSGDFLVLSGSVQQNVTSEIYGKLCRIANESGVKTVVDATGKLLLGALPEKPFLIKPNKYELEEIFGVNIVSDDDLIKYAKKLQEYGAQNVLVSLGSDGALLVDENGETHFMSAPQIKPVYTVGSGDSMVAGFIYGYMKKSSFEDALRWGTACGSATASSASIATKTDVNKIYNLL